MTPAAGETSCMGQTEPTVIINATRGSVVCHRGLIADRSLTRMRGLLGRRGLPAGEGLLLRPGSSIHTAFMHFVIDAVMLDSELRIVKLVPNLRPWHTASARRARAVLELADGEIARCGLHVDDRLEVCAPTVLDQASGHAALDLCSPARVLVVAADRRFRMFASTSLARRGYHVTVRNGTADIVELAVRECADVVVIDATASITAAVHEVARLQTIRPLLGMVVVSEDPQQGLSTLPILPRWGSLDSLCAAIEQAGADRRSAEVRYAGR